MISYQSESGRIWVGGRAAVLGDGADGVKAWAEKHVRRDRDIKWLLGNYVEADNANSNGHIFPLADLQEYGLATIPNKPLNMLHHGRYVIGSLVATELVTPPPSASDSPNPVVELLSGMWPGFFPDEAALIQRAHSEGSLYYCVDPDTEILTGDGWKRYDSLRVGEPVLSLDTERGVSKWTPLRKVFTYEVDGQMLRMEGQMHSSLTTLNHRWWVRRLKSRGGFVDEFRRSDELTTMSRIPRAVPYEAEVEPKWSDALVEAVAWFATEGTDPGVGGVTIYQSHLVNPGFTSRIRAVLSVLAAEGRVRDGGEWYATEHGKMTHFHLSKGLADRIRVLAPCRIPTGEFLRSLTAAQLRLFVETCIDGDGTRAQTDGQVTFSQKEEAAARAFEMACALAGLPTNTAQQPNGMWRVCVIRRSDWITPMVNARRNGGFVAEKVDYQGLVWCPNTEFGTFLARRRGTVFWTGNSMECLPGSVTCPDCSVTAQWEGFESENYCAHMNASRVSRKRLNQPHFNAGAAIVPPVQPGWTNADIGDVSAMLKKHAEKAEALYANIQEDAPHLGPAQWERLMTEVVAMAETPR